MQDRMSEDASEANADANPSAAGTKAGGKEVNGANRANDASDPAATSLASTAASILSDRKTHLAIGVAATLGLMVFYNWREKNLAKTDPEEYARIQRIKASVRNKGKERAPAEEASKNSKASAKKNAADE